MWCGLEAQYPGEIFFFARFRSHEITKVLDRFQLSKAGFASLASPISYQHKYQYIKNSRPVRTCTHLRMLPFTNMTSGWGDVCNERLVQPIADSGPALEPSGLPVHLTPITSLSKRSHPDKDPSYRQLEAKCCPTCPQKPTSSFRRWIKRTLLVAGCLVAEAGSLIPIHNYRPVRDRGEAEKWYAWHENTVSKNIHFGGWVLKGLAKWFPDKSQRSTAFSGVVCMLFKLTAVPCQDCLIYLVLTLPAFSRLNWFKIPGPQPLLAHAPSSRFV